jgi:hypothetical protein
MKVLRAWQIKSLKRFQAKWTPVRVKKTRQIKNLEPRFDSIETEEALGRSTGELWTPHDPGQNKKAKPRADRLRGQPNK